MPVQGCPGGGGDGTTFGATTRGFDAQALFAAVDRRRRQDALSWAGVARQVWAESADLNAHLGDHPISASTVLNLRRRGDTSCQHALLMLRWLERAPEDFIAAPAPGTAGVPLPAADPSQRLRWNLSELHEALDAARLARGAGWPAVAARLRCTPNQLTGLRTARFGPSMRLAMRICQGLRRPAADFVHAVRW